MSDSERISLFENMAASDPENELAHFSLGKLYLEAGRAAEAEVSLRRTLELNAQHTQAHRLLGEALIALDRAPEAHELLARGVLLAHERGEYQPRNQMVELLRSRGVEPPGFEAEETVRTEAGGAEGDWRCSRCLGAKARLEKPPFRSELGQRIHEKICEECWKEWMAMSIKVINEFRLNPATPEGSQLYDQQLVEFLGLES